MTGNANLLDVLDRVNNILTGIGSPIILTMLGLGVLGIFISLRR